MQRIKSFIGRNRGEIGYAVFGLICLLLMAALFTPLPALAQSVTGVHFELGGAKLLVESGGTIEAKSGGALVLDSGSTATFDSGSITTYASGSTLNVPAASLAVGSATFTGAIKYGTAATYTSGTSITHGFTTTPTICIISPMQNITATYTITATGFSTNMQTTGNPVYWMCGK